MGRNDTAIGGEGRSFPTTVWSRIRLVGDGSRPEIRDELDGLCRTYWKPVYAYIRTACRKSVEDSKDLTQAFFTHLFQKGVWSRLDSERGSFRGFLKRAVRNFVLNAQRQDASRRPDKPVFRLDVPDAELDRLGPAAPDESPEAAYEREWFGSLMDDAIEALRAELETAGRHRDFEVFRRYCLEPHQEPERTPQPEPGDPTYQNIAADLGITVHDVRYSLHKTRERLRSLLRARIHAYVGADRDVEDELQEALSRALE